MNCKVFITGALMRDQLEANRVRRDLLAAGFSVFVPGRLCPERREVIGEAEADRRFLGCCDAVIRLGEMDELSRADWQYAYECAVPRFDSVEKLMEYCR